MNRILLTQLGLKWNPFSTELPSEALYLSPKINDFFWRIENVHVREGGFALIQGDPGTGKSVVLRALADRLERQTRSHRRHPQSPAEQSGRLLSRAGRSLWRLAQAQ